MRVPGYGETDHPKLMLVAEAPGEMEKEKGKPLIGRSGQLLRRLLKDVGVDEKQCFFTNTCLCKGPGPNAAPTATMVNACYDGLLEEIEAVKPKLVVALGNHAAKALGQYKRGVQSVRGQYRQLELDSGRRVGILPTYHPAAVLRNPELFRDLMTDLQRAYRIGFENEEPQTLARTDKYRIIETKKALHGVLEELEEDATVCSLDVETTGKRHTTGHILDLGLCWKPGLAISIDWTLFDRDTIALVHLGKLLSRIPIVMQEAKFDMAWMWAQGIRPNLVMDTAIAHWLLDERGRIHALDQMATQYFGAPDYKGRFKRKYGQSAWTPDEEVSFESALPHDRRIYNATDADYTLRLAMLFKRELKAQGLLKLNKLLIECVYLYTELYVEGIHVDWEYVGELKKELEKKIAAAEAVTIKMAPNVNPRSPKQLAAYLFDELKLKPFGGVPADGEPIPEEVLSAAIRQVDDPVARAYWQKTASGGRDDDGDPDEQQQERRSGAIKSRSTSKFMLYYLAQQHPFPKALIEYREAKKRLSLWIGDVEDNRWEDDKVHPSYKINATLNGRFTSKDPSMHTLPPGPLYNMYVAPPGYVILHADYAQADMRVLAHFSQDEHYAAWLRGSDPHTDTVKAIGGFTDAQIKAMPKEELRSRRMGAKMISFGLPYGRGPDSLAPQMGISVDEARRYVQQYWLRAPKLKKWIDTRLLQLRKDGQEIVSPFGNRRRLPLLVDRRSVSSASRLAVNMPVMSTVNYLTALAHLRVVQTLRDAGIDTRVYPHIHDSFNVAVPLTEVDEAVRILVEVAEAVPEYIGVDLEFIPFHVEVTAGYRWGTQVVVYERGKQTKYKRALEELHNIEVLKRARPA